MKWWFFALAALILALPLGTAHEVYVLDEETVSSGLATEGINVASSLKDTENQFLFLTGTAVTVALLIVLLRLTHTRWSQKLDAGFGTVRPYAHLVVRVGLGIALTWGAIDGAVFGPEIPIASLPGGAILQPLLFAIGLLLLFGLFTRLAALLALAVWFLVLIDQSFYALGYLSYLGVLLVLILERGEKHSLDAILKWPSHIFHPKLPAQLERLERLGEQYTFPLIRIAFGLAVLYAAISIKIMHPALSLSVISEFGLFTSFAALFVVFAAALIELAVGLLIMLGVLVRPVMVIFLFLMVCSMIIFKELVWPHAILIAAALGLFLHGKDRWCLEDRIYGLFMRARNQK